MKHIKLFEGVDLDGEYKIEFAGKTKFVDKKFDKQYLDYIFAEFLDGYSCKSELVNFKSSASGISYRYELEIKLDDIIDTPNDLKKYAEQLSRYSDDLEDCFGKVTDEYPNLKCEIYFMTQTDRLIVWVE